MYYKGSRYNIPMTFWIVEMYPYHPPVCFVSPTANMMIKSKHKHVDDNGQCYLPYTANWNPSSSDLYELVNQLSAIFGTDPPVFQKSATTTTTNTNVSNHSIPSGTYPPPFQPPTGSMYGSTYPGTYPSYGMNSSMYNQRKPTEEELKIQLVNKVRQHLQNVTLKEYGSKIEAEFKTQNQLTAREKQLEVVEQRMKTELDQIEKERETLTQKISSLETWIQNNENKPIDVDVIINPQDIQSKQILDLTSEEMAIDDVIYFLEKKLHSKQITLDDWLDQVRELSRQQFLKKALVKKISN